MSSDSSRTEKESACLERQHHSSHQEFIVPLESQQLQQGNRSTQHQPPRSPTFPCRTQPTSVTQPTFEPRGGQAIPSPTSKAAA